LSPKIKSYGQIKTHKYPIVAENSHNST